MTPEAVAALARSYVGLPFATGARGPHAYDCLGVVVSIAWEAGALPWGWDFGLLGPIKARIQNGGFGPLPGARQVERQPLLGDLVIWGDVVSRGVGVVTEPGENPLVVFSVPQVGVVERRLSSTRGTRVVAYEFSTWSPEELFDFGVMVNP